jgi:ubiquinone/menaquinone biosynthesis C-methylase UbiE
MPTAIDPTVVFFDKTADRYDGEYSAETPGGHALRVRRKKVLDLFDQPGGKVLDVGCGPAVMTEALLARGCTFWGVDPSSRMIDIARKRFKEDDRVHFVSGDAVRLDFPDGFFDAAVCMGVIDMVQDRRQAVREMLRVLKPGGTLIITFTNLSSPYAWWKLYVFYPLVSVWHRLRDRNERARPDSGLAGQVKRRALFTEGAAHELLQSEGATVAESVGYYYNVFLSPLDEVCRSAALKTTQYLEENHSARWRWLAAGWIVKARKETDSENRRATRAL